MRRRQQARRPALRLPMARHRDEEGGVAVGVGEEGIGVLVGDAVGGTVVLVCVAVGPAVLVGVGVAVAPGVEVGVAVQGKGWVGTGTCSVRELFCSLLSATALFGSTTTVIAAPV